MPSLIEIGLLVLEKKIFLKTLKRGYPLHLNRFKSPLPKDDLCQVWFKLALLFWRRFFKIFSVFLLFCGYLPLETSNPLHFNNLESPPPQDDLCQVWLRLAQWFWRRFLYDPTPFLNFCDYLPFEEDLTRYLNKLEFPSPKDNLYQV